MSDDAAQVELGAASTPFVLAVDIGSSSARAGLLDAGGRRIADSLQQTRYQLTTDAGGAATLDPRELASVVENLIDHALAGCGAHADAIRGVGLSTFWHSLLGVDAAGEPVTPVFMWADTRAAGQVTTLRGRLDEAAYHRTTGCFLHPSYWPAKLLWLQTCEPALWSSARRWVSIGDYLLQRFCGGASSSVSMASGTGLFDESRQQWDQQVLDAVEIQRDALLPISDEPQRGLAREYRSRWPALADVAWYPALGDGACSNLGSGASDQDRLGVTVGTTGAMRLLWPGAAVEPPSGLWLYRLDAQRVILGGALSEGGNLFEWVSTRFRLPDLPQLLQELSRMEVDSHQLTWLPFLAGERAPGWRGDARAVIAGLTLDTQGIDVLRAGLEAVAERFMLLLRLIDEAAPGDRSVVASGAALLSDPLWLQILSDALGREVVAPREREASCRGAGLMALARLGVVDDLDAVAAEVLSGAPRFQPDAANHERYLRALARQESLYRQIYGAAGGSDSHSSRKTL